MSPYTKRFAIYEVFRTEVEPRQANHRRLKVTGVYRQPRVDSNQHGHWMYSDVVAQEEPELAMADALTRSSSSRAAIAPRSRCRPAQLPREE